MYPRLWDIVVILWCWEESFSSVCSFTASIWFCLSDGCSLVWNSLYSKYCMWDANGFITFITFPKHFHLRSSCPQTLKSIQMWVNQKYCKQDTRSNVQWNLEWFVIKTSSLLPRENCSARSETTLLQFTQVVFNWHLLVRADWDEATDLIWLLLVTHVLVWILHTLKRTLEMKCFILCHHKP